MVNLIQNIPSVNNGEQHKDNDNSITKYIESNKDRIMDLAEKHYENLVDALTNDAITAVGSSNSTLSLLPSSSSIFPNSFDQSDTFRKEESEIYDNDQRKPNEI